MGGTSSEIEHKGSASLGIIEIVFVLNAKVSSNSNLTNQPKKTDESPQMRLQKAKENLEDRNKLE